MWHVTQGSIFGPLLSLIYVSNIGRSNNFSILSFADDTVTSILVSL